MATTQRITKQSQTRDSVIELIEQLGVGRAIPSERQLSSDLGVSRLTVRAALDDLVRDGYLVRRRGSGTFVREPKIAQELTMTSFSEDMERRGMRPGSKTLSLETTTAGAYLGRALHVSPSERIVVAKRLRMADNETMAIETLHVPRVVRSRPAAGRPGPRIVLRAPVRPVRDRARERRADDRADGDERGGVGGARRPAPLARVPVRADEPARARVRSSSSCARSTAATGTDSSPS